MKKIVYLLLGALLILGLAACTSSEPASETETEVITVVETVVVEVEAVDPVEAERRQVLIFDLEGGKQGDPENWNPYSSGRPNVKGMFSMSEMLFYINMITGELTPWLGESMTPNADFTEWTLVLRDGIKWSDGEVFDADDVLFTVNMLKDFPELNTPNKFEGVTAEKVDDLTIKFTLEKSDPRFQMTYFEGRGDTSAFHTVPEHIWKDYIDDPVTFRNYDPDLGWPVFTGAYTLDTFTDSEFRFVRDDNWWGAETGFAPLPAPPKLTWIYYGTEETRAAAMAKNDLDTMNVASPASFDTLQTLNENVIAWLPEPPYGWTDICTRNLEFNTRVAPWDDPDMRWAVNYAIDRVQLVDIGYSGAASPSTFHMPAFPALKYYMDLVDYSQFPIATYDPELAKSALENLGYVMNEATGYYEKDGQELVMPIVNFDDTIINAMNGALVEQLQSVGINAVQDIQTIPTFIDNLMGGTLETYIFFGSCGSTTDPWKSMDSYSVRHISDDGSPPSSFYSNAGYWDTDNAVEYSGYIEEIGLLQPGDPQIDDLFVKAAELWLEELPAIPLIQQPIVLPFNTTYWTNWPTAENAYLQPDLSAPNAYLLVHNVQPTQ